MASLEHTIIYITDNSLEDRLATICRNKLVEAADGIQIISVSQKPLEFGKNICVGDIGRNHLSLFKQLTMGVLLATTPVIVIAEHDCLYSPEHLNWDPPALDVFYYNNNQWFVQYGGEEHGTYSHRRRRVLSQLVVGRDIARKALMERIDLLETGYTLTPGAPGACEPGVMDARAFVAPQNKDLGKDIKKWKAEIFQTINPNLDIRHTTNFSGGGSRMTRQQTKSVPYWGKFEDVVGKV